MIKIVRKAPFYFVGLLLFLAAGALVLFNIEQGDMILYFAERRNTLGNTFFQYFTKLGEEHIYIILVSIFVFVRFRYAILSVMSGISALLIAWILKTFFARPRPLAYFTQLDRVADTNPIDGVYLYSGMTSFPSGHTMSAFAVFTLVALLYAHKPIWTVLCLLIAVLVGVSRVYLVQHFFEDVFLGAILGTLVGILLYWLQSRVPVNEIKWFDRSFRHPKDSKNKIA